MTCRFAPLLLATALLAAPALALAQDARPDALPAWDQLTPAQRKLLIAPMRDRWNREPERRPQMLEFAKRWQSMPPPQRDRAPQARGVLLQDPTRRASQCRALRAGVGDSRLRARGLRAGLTGRPLRRGARGIEFRPKTWRRWRDFSAGHRGGAVVAPAHAPEALLELLEQPFHVAPVRSARRHCDAA